MAVSLQKRKRTLLLNILKYTTMERKVNWTLESVREEARKYSSRIEFRKGNDGAYSEARKKYPEILDEIFGERRNSVLTK